MNRLAQLRAERETARAEGLAIINAAEADDRDLTDEEQSQVDSIHAAIEDLDTQIASAEALAERRRNFEPQPGSQISATPPAPAAGQNRVNDQDPRATGGFGSLGEFASAVHGAVLAGQYGGAVDSRLTQLAVAGTHQGGGTAGEGYALPPQFRSEIWDIVHEMDEFGPLIDEEPTASRSVKLNADETTPWGTSGIKAYWRAEGKQMTPSELADEGRDVPVHELYVLALATEELLEDAPRLQNRLTRKAGEAIAWKKGQAIVEGKGVGQPLGWTASKAQITVPKETGQPAGSLVVENIAKMNARLQMMPGSTPFWMMNQELQSELITMTLGDRPIWTPPNGIVDAPGGFLLGKPIRYSEHSEAPGAKNDIQLVNPKGYYGVRRTAGTNFASSIHLYFDFAINAFRWTFRYGGQPHLSKPITPNKGTATRSHFITLAERA